MFNANFPYKSLFKKHEFCLNAESTVIYLAAITGINPELYEAARIDGANRFHLMRYITLPSIACTIVVL